MSNRIYIMGPIGSGKTTFSKKLSEKLKIDRYELDKIIYDDINGNVKRDIKEVQRLFNNIIKKDSWIIEDVGRSKFIKGREKADIIYYIKISKIRAYYRVVRRWIRQRIGIEEFGYPPSLKQLKYFITTVNSYYKKEKDKINSLKIYGDKVIFVNTNMINKIGG